MSLHAQAVSQTVGEIASALAGATAVFRKHKIDFCCGGAVSLDEAARKRGVDPAIVLVIGAVLVWAFEVFRS